MNKNQLKNRKIEVLNKLKELNKELYDINKLLSPKWVVVLDDSNCTVGIGGEGYLWEVDRDSGKYWMLKGIGSPYNKSIFRAATEEEIDNWIKNKTRANVPKHGKPLLYCGY